MMVVVFAFLSIPTPIQSAGSLFNVGAPEVIDGLNKFGQKTMDDLNKFSQKTMDDLDKKLDKSQTFAFTLLGYMNNEIRLLPGFAMGAQCLIFAIRIYADAMINYFEDTSITSEEKAAVRKKIWGKIKAASGLLALGTGIFYFNGKFAKQFLGYNPETSANAMSILAQTNNAIATPLR